MKLAALRLRPGPNITRAGREALEAVSYTPQALKGIPRELKDTLSIARAHTPTPVTSQEHLDEFLELKRRAEALGAKARIGNPIDIHAASHLDDVRERLPLLNEEAMAHAANVNRDIINQMRRGMDPKMLEYMDNRPDLTAYLPTARRPMKGRPIF